MATGETPYLEDQARKATTHGTAIFGDKQADLLSAAAPEGQASSERGDELKEDASHAAAILAINQAARNVSMDEFAAHGGAHGGDVSQDRVDAVITQSTPVVK